RASVASQTSRTTCTLRFLRAVRVQTGCANNAWWDRLLIKYAINNRRDHRGTERDQHQIIPNDFPLIARIIR
ncbi:hypothetical protein E0S43_20495, partial [Salmonella enterica subsp. enterica serovar Kandla]|nr:hypothetical protein [Salmonella enterica subsp. enterica serovar Kandla]